MSRTHRFQSRMKTARLPSGDTDSAHARRAAAALPGRLVRRRGAAASVRLALGALHVALPALAVGVERDTDCPSCREVDFGERQRSAVELRIRGAREAAASFAWSNAGARVPLTGSTSTNSLPSAVVTRYQKRSSASHTGPHTAAIHQGRGVVAT